MSLQEFSPTTNQLELLQSIFVLTQDNWIAVSHIFDAGSLLNDMNERGIEYIVTRSGDQAGPVLDHVPGVSMASMRVADPVTLRVFKIQTVSEEVLSGGSYRRNAGALKLTPDESYWSQNLNAYSNWRESWWREAIQNSSDACKTLYDRTGQRGRISCEKLYVEGTDDVIIKITDNGIGMTHDILVGAFLTLGGSLKRGVEGSVGGLGMAKELLVHAWPQWSIHTRHHDASANEAVFVSGKYNPHFFDIFTREKGEPVPDDYEGRWIGNEPRSKTGTEMIVTMKRDKCVDRTDLVRFLGFSDISHARVKYREGNLVDGRVEAEDWQTVEARNRIPASATPIVTLTRPSGVGAGSAWARIYHMPRARSFKEVAVRINGLFMFTAMGSYDNIPGKVIIELFYLPKGKRYDRESNSWIPLSTEQDDSEYGPLEMLQESRTALQYAYQWRLEQWLDHLKKEPKQVLKRRRPPRIVRARNKSSGSTPWAEILEQIEPKELLAGNQDSIDRIREQEQQRLVNHLQLIIEQAKEDNIPPSRAIREVLSDNQVAQLKRSTDIAPEIKEIVKDLEIAIDTSADKDFWRSEITPKLMKEAKKDGLGDAFVTNMVKFLHWEPDFILFDETSSAEEYKEAGESEDDSSNRDKYGHLISRAPDQWSPDTFGAKERRFAKFWVEIIRLCFILIGRGGNLIDSTGEGLGLQAGFHFENPPHEDEPFEVQSEALGVFRQIPDKNMRAIFITPGMLKVTPSRNHWSHRYQLAKTSAKDTADILAVAFHEIGHALHPSGGHDTEFASILTHYGINLAFRYSTLVNKVLDHAIATHRVRSPRGSGPKIQRGKKIEPGMGYYVVDCDERRGRKPKKATYREAFDTVKERFNDGKGYPGSTVIRSHYMDKGGESHEVNDWLESFYDDPDVEGHDFDAPVDKARRSWDRRRDWDKFDDDRPSSEIFFRRNPRRKSRKLRRYRR